MIKACHITNAHNRYDVTLIVNDEVDDEAVDNIKIVSIGQKGKQAKLDRIFQLKRF